MQVAVLEKQVYFEGMPVPGVWELLTIGKDFDSVVKCLDGFEEVFGELIETKVGEHTIMFNDHCAFRIRNMEVVE